MQDNQINGVETEEEMVKCPFCFTESKRGISVCRGCQATVEYGSSILGYLIVAIVGGFFLSNYSFILIDEYIIDLKNLNSSGTLDIIIFVVGVLLSIFIYKLIIKLRSKDADRKVTFKRHMPK